MVKAKAKAKAAKEHSEEEEEAHASNRKKEAGSGDEDVTLVCELSKNRKVLVRKFAGTVFVDIREFYNKDGEDLPGKKGISLPLEQWEILRPHLKDVQDLLTSLG